MNNMLNGAIGVVGSALLMAVDTSTVTTWVSCICSAVIALVTCGLQVYRMIRDRDKETTTEEKKEDNKEED